MRERGGGGGLFLSLEGGVEGENSSCQIFHMVHCERKDFNHQQPEEKGFYFYHSWCIMCKAAGEDIDYLFFIFCIVLLPVSYGLLC